MKTIKTDELISTIERCLSELNANNVSTTTGLLMELHENLMSANVKLLNN